MIMYSELINLTHSIFSRVAKTSFLILITCLLVLSGAPVVAITRSQREILDSGVDYFNECLQDDGSGAGTSSGQIAGSNKDYAGNQIFTDEELEKIEELSPFYIAAAEKYDMPWQILAVIHKRESNFMKGGPGNGQGPYQMAAGGYKTGPYSDEEFQKATDEAAAFFSNKANGRDLHDPDNIKYTFFAYNGMAELYKKQARDLGFSQEEADNGEGSPYVMNKADAKRDPATAAPNTWGQIKEDYGDLVYPANEDHGAFVMYQAISNSSDGSISIPEKSNERFIWVGDSRTDGIKNAVNDGNNEWITSENADYDWFTSEGISKVTEQLKEGETVVFFLGLNDLDRAEDYKTKLNELAKGDWSKAGEIIVVSLTPVDEEKAEEITNEEIEEFNKTIRNGLASNITYRNIYSQVAGDMETVDDGINYDSETYQNIYSYIRGIETSEAKCGTTGGSTIAGTSNEKIAKLANEWGAWGDQYQACYTYGGGHGVNASWMDQAIENHFTGSYAVDCSAFVSAVIYKASGTFKIWSTTSMCGDTTNFQEVDDPQPGDISISCASHVEIIVSVNEDGSFNTVGSHQTGCGAGNGPSPGNYKGDKVLRYIGPGSDNDN